MMIDSLTFVDNTFKANDREETTANCSCSDSNQDYQPEKASGVAPSFPFEELASKALNSHDVSKSTNRLYRTVQYST